MDFCGNSILERHEDELDHPRSDDSTLTTTTTTTSKANTNSERDELLPLQLLEPEEFCSERRSGDKTNEDDHEEEEEEKQANSTPKKETVSLEPSQHSIIIIIIISGVSNQMKVEFVIVSVNKSFIMTHLSTRDASWRLLYSIPFFSIIIFCCSPTIRCSPDTCALEQLKSRR